MCLKNEKCKDCDYVWDCPHSIYKGNTDSTKKTSVSTKTIHTATRFEEKETVVLINGKECSVQKIACKGNKVVLIVSE